METISRFRLVVQELEGFDTNSLSRILYAGDAFEVVREDARNIDIQSTRFGMEILRTPVESLTKSVEINAQDFLRINQQRMSPDSNYTLNAINSMAKRSLQQFDYDTNLYP